jgi:hypothetical protein
MNPTYPSDRAQRAMQWAAPLYPSPNADPSHLPNAVADHRPRIPRCRVHHKSKCISCSEMNSRIAPTVEACCQLHHRDDDGLPVAICDEHSMTRCGECVGPELCCTSGHHRCEQHKKPACTACGSLPTLAERRPQACCARDHHARKRPRRRPSAEPATKRTNLAPDAPNGTAPVKEVPQPRKRGRPVERSSGEDRVSVKDRRKGHPPPSRSSPPSTPDNTPPRGYPPLDPHPSGMSCDPGRPRKRPPPRRSGITRSKRPRQRTPPATRLRHSSSGRTNTSSSSSPSALPAALPNPMPPADQLTAACKRSAAPSARPPLENFEMIGGSPPTLSSNASSSSDGVVT